MEVDDRSQEQRAQTFERLFMKICSLLERFGQHDSLLGPGDYSVYGAYAGYPQVKISVRNLEMLRTPIVERLQAVLKAFPDWEIVVAVTVPGHLYDWPDMGIIIRRYEIIDGLQRQYFPPQFQAIQYQGSRVGTDHD